MNQIGQNRKSFKEAVSQLTIGGIITLYFLSLPNYISAQTTQFEITISIDYIDEQEIYLSPNGETAIVLLYGAGFIEKQKYADRYNSGFGNSPLVPEKWRPIKKVNILGFSINVPMPPFGDNPVDFQWIVKGILFYNKNTQK
ncbi:MAG: hypothetical protein J5604_03250 [Bacteroidales bacterium]|nr:hypothetical protein [Bacteroidales bacterium]